MYLSYYNLKEKPFQISSDPRYLWLGEKHKEALATLRYGIYDNKGFLLLTGDVGTGKTTLINKLLDSLGEDVLAAVIFDPGLEVMDLLNYIAHAFGIKKILKSKGEFIIVFSRFLHQAHGRGRKVLLVIDEAQRLSPEALEEIRLLSNIERYDTKLINIFFAGQNEFNALLLEKRNRAIRQRLTLNYNISPLDLSETRQYIAHRFLVAGFHGDIFTPGAEEEIFKFSEGFPRQINIICDYALMAGYAKERDLIDEEIIHECVQDLKLAPEGMKDLSVSASGKEKSTSRWRHLFLCLAVAILLALAVYAV